jgi:hypothetical protein
VLKSNKQKVLKVRSRKLSEEEMEADEE